MYLILCLRRKLKKERENVHITMLAVNNLCVFAFLIIIQLLQDFIASLQQQLYFFLQMNSRDHLKNHPFQVSWYLF